MKQIQIFIIATLVFLLNADVCFTEIVVVESGNVGIGTTDDTGYGKHPASPEKTFEVRKNVGAEGVLARFYNTYGPWNGTALIDFVTEYGYPTRGRVQIGYMLDAATKGSFIVKTGEAERLRVDGNGDLGIGTTDTGHGKHPASPEKAFEVRKNVEAEGVLARFYNTYGPWNGTALIDFMTEYGYPTRGRVQIGYILDAATNGSFIVKTNEAERLRINGNGHVGIGTTDPRGKLDVNGAIYQRGSQLHADYVFEPDYQFETIKEHAEFMWKNKHLRAIPQSSVDEEGREVLELGSHRKGIVEELEKAHIYIEQLHTKINAMERSIKIMEKNYKKMEEKFTKLAAEFNINGH